MSPAVVASDLRKRYGSSVALDGLSFEVASGRVTGFLGPNGAGKTTTFRVLLGLTRPDSGTASVVGMDVATDLAKIVKRVGAIVDEPGLLRPLTGRQNLVIAAHTLGFGHDRIPQLVEFVELTDSIDRAVSGYSKGMRQRLALAAAMVGDPEVLFLDEPLDGLDPAGQHAFKDRLRSLAADEGRTVLISSHALADVQELADDVVVIARGSLRFQGSLAEMMGQTETLRVRVDDAVRALSVLQSAGLGGEIDGGSEIVLDHSDGSSVVEALAREGIYPSAVIPVAPTLEKVFLEMTEDGS